MASCHPLATIRHHVVDDCALVQVLRLQVDPIQEDNYLGSIVCWQRLNVELQIVKASYLIMRDCATLSKQVTSERECWAALKNFTVRSGKGTATGQIDYW